MLDDIFYGNKTGKKITHYLISREVEQGLDFGTPDLQLSVHIGGISYS